MQIDFGFSEEKREKHYGHLHNELSKKFINHFVNQFLLRILLFKSHACNLLTTKTKGPTRNQFDTFVKFSIAKLEHVSSDALGEHWLSGQLVFTCHVRFPQKISKKLEHIDRNGLSLDSRKLVQLLLKSRICRIVKQLCATSLKRIYETLRILCLMNHRRQHLPSLIPHIFLFSPPHYCQLTQKRILPHSIEHA